MVAEGGTGNENSDPAASPAGSPRTPWPQRRLWTQRGKGEVGLQVTLWLKLRPRRYNSLHFHCRGLGFHPWSGKFHMLHGMAKKKKKAGL